jgi:hypothetical protein
MIKSAFVIVLALSAVPAAAASLDDLLLTDSGTPLQECVKVNDVDKTKCDKYGDLKIGVALSRMVDVRYQGEENMKLSAIVERAKLADKLRDGVNDLSPEEVTIIKALLPKTGQSARVIYQMCVAVDPKCS